MSAVLLDTHAWIWAAWTRPVSAMVRRQQSSRRTPSTSVPSASTRSFAKARLGKWPEIAPHIDALLTETQTVSAPLTRAVAARAGALDWTHRDPFDRIIAATAIEMGWALISKDAEFDALDGTPGWRGRVWS